MSEAATFIPSQSEPAPATSPSSEAQTPNSAQPPATPHASAVARCVDAYTRTFKTERARTRNEFNAEKCAKKAFCAALPPLVGYENVRDFIACITQAMLLGVVPTADASKLLYAAQVALAAIRMEPAPDTTRPR